MELKIPDFGVVLLVGASGSGKSSFARKNFLTTEILSSDTCRGWVSDDETSLDATDDAFDVLHYVLAKRLKRRMLTVIDATNVHEHARRSLIKIAGEYHALTTAIVFNVDERICQERNKLRPDRQFGEHVVRNHVQALRRSLRTMDRKEGIRNMHVLRSVEEIDGATILREPAWNDKRTEKGPFDIVGDIHGCFDELVELLAKLGYVIEENEVAPEGEKPRFWEDMAWYKVTAPEGRKAIFLGDLVDRGPDSPRVLKLVMSMVAAGQALAVPGNHDEKLTRKLGGREVKVAHGLAETLAQLEKETDEFSGQVRRFLGNLVSHYWLDDGKLVVAHAGLKEEMHGRTSGRVRDFSMYGETTGETDEFGLPIRYNWASEYRGRANVIYGHTPVPEPEWLNRTVNIDTGCVFGGNLTALRYPEMDMVSVPAKALYAEPRKPFRDLPAGLSAQQEYDDLLDLAEVTGRRFVQTALKGNVTIREENGVAALEAMSRFAANPKWLVYLPPTMSPTETTEREGFLEYPEEGFAYFRNQGVGEVVCEEKHMGSRAVVAICRDESVAEQRFGVKGDGRGVIYTRTGRRFFDDKPTETALLDVFADAFEKSGLLEELGTDWAVLDCELMPWSAKAQELLRRQYAAVGCAADASTAFLAERLSRTSVEGAQSIAEKLAERRTMAGDFVEAYRRYCWTVNSLEDFKIAPFHLLATEGHVYDNKDHLWHMETLKRLCDADERKILFTTRYRKVDTTDADAVREACLWWEEMTASGGEGMVIKPLTFVAKGPRGLIQPAVKCRGREYLRIIYGPEYTQPEHLSRLKKRSVTRKRGLAISEFALGLEGLRRFVDREPLRRVHECAFGVLAMESEPVDPRL